MVGKRKRSVYRKKRKGFSGVRQHEIIIESGQESSESSDNNNHPQQQSLLTDSDDNAPVISASRKKLLKNLNEESESPSRENESVSLDGNCEDGKGYRLVDLQNLSEVLSDVHGCEGDIQIKETGRHGLMSNLKLECTSCHEKATLPTSKNITAVGKSFDANRRAVYSAIEMGCGYEEMVTHYSILNMPFMSKTAYYQQLDVIKDVLEAEAKEDMKRAGQELRQLVLSENGEEDRGQPVDVAVSFDGTWAKRGFTSLTGVVVALSIDTGEVLDYHVLSKGCQKCSINRTKYNDEEAFSKWHMEHVANGECDINFDGSSPAMEAEGARVLWSRSLTCHNLRYRWMICDGDSKSFITVKDLYEDCTVEKQDCVGHVQKRMGKHLLNLKSRTKGNLADGKSIGGKGRLTEVKIKKLQKDYGLAIRQNTCKKANVTTREEEVAVYSMKKNIIASLHHNIQSSNPSSQHRFCPRGQMSWCKWQQDSSSGTSTYKGDNCLPEVFLELLKPVYVALSDTDLLKRCVRGATQNQNESINSTIWTRCPKHKHHGPNFIQCAVASAVLHFHHGASSRDEVMKKLLIPAGGHTKSVSAKKDLKRVKQSDLRSSEKEKKRRQGLQFLRTQREEALKDAEGITYGAGAF